MSAVREGGRGARAQAAIVGVACLAIVLAWALPAAAADTTPPTRPSVVDDGAYTSSTTTLHARWSSTDPESGVAEYQYLIRQDSILGPIILNWASVGLATEVTRADLSLIHGKRYYFKVKARNRAGLWSAEGYSNGIKVDTTPPSAPGQLTEGALGVDFDYDTDGGYTLSWKPATDPESGIATYELQEGTSAGGPWTTVRVTSGRYYTVSRRQHGVQYVYRVRAKNMAGLWGPWSTASDGILVDTTPPAPVAFIEAGTTTTLPPSLHASWTTAGDPESGVVDYQYIVRDVTAFDTIVSDWRSVGLVTDVVHEGLCLFKGRSYVIGVRARNGAGSYSAPAYSPPITVRTDPPPPPAGYEGFGATTTGGDGKDVYYVTTLDDSGPGSLRDAVSQGDRHVVFAVAGVIETLSRIYVRGANITIDGFTAPPPGITVRNYGLVIAGSLGAHDVIVRGIRIRVVNDQVGKEDGISIQSRAFNVAVDRVSVHGASDESIGINNARDVTVSWSILAEPRLFHPANMLISGRATRASVHHNLFIKASRRNPWVAYGALEEAPEIQADVRNNLMWDVSGKGSGHGTVAYAGAKLNVVGNYYNATAGLDEAGQKRVITLCRVGTIFPEDLAFCGTRLEFPRIRAYVADNISADGWTEHINGKGTEGEPFAAPPVTTADACTSAQQVLDHAGAPLLDAFDRDLVCLIGCREGS